MLRKEMRHRKRIWKCISLQGLGEAKESRNTSVKEFLGRQEGCEETKSQVT